MMTHIPDSRFDSRHPDQDARVTVGRVLVAVGRPTPLVLLVRWRYEIALLAAAGYGVYLVGPFWAVAGATTAAGTLAIRPARAFVTGRLWCVVTPHRLRTGCAQAWVHSRAGKVPAILWTSSTPYGERVVLWCHAGTSATDVSTAAPALAAACWAQSVHVEQNPRHAQLVVVHVVRRDTEIG